MAGKTEKVRAAVANSAPTMSTTTKWTAMCANMNLDEDEMVSFLQHQYTACPYFSFSDDYKLRGASK